MIEISPFANRKFPSPQRVVVDRSGQLLHIAITGDLNQGRTELCSQSAINARPILRNVAVKHESVEPSAARLGTAAARHPDPGQTHLPTRFASGAIALRERFRFVGVPLLE